LFPTSIDVEEVCSTVVAVELALEGVILIGAALAKKLSEKSSSARNRWRYIA